MAGGGRRRGGAEAKMEVLGVRRSDFSLKIRAIRPSAVFGTRRKAALRGEGFAWVPDLRSFDKLLEVGGFSLLEFYPRFKCFMNV